MDRYQHFIFSAGNSNLITPSIFSRSSALSYAAEAFEHRKILVVSMAFMVAVFTMNKKRVTIFASVFLAASLAAGFFSMFIDDRMDSRLYPGKYKILIHFSASESAALSQNWRIDKEDVFSSVQPNNTFFGFTEFAAHQILSYSGQVKANASPPAFRRMSSVPVRIFPHWSLPPHLLLAVLVFCTEPEKT
jgi:hypothetical protein